MEVQFFTLDSPFHKYYNKVKLGIKPDEWKKFSTLSSPEDRIQFCLNLPGIHDVKVTAHKSIKDLEKAMEYKAKGNEAFKAKEFQEAFHLYTKSLQYYPMDESTPLAPINRDYSIILANRSAALEHSNLYASACKDISKSLQFGYPKELCYKIYKRLGHCELRMKQYNKAKEACETCLKFIGKSDIKKEKERDAYRAKVRKQMTVFNVSKTLYNLELNDPHPSTLAGSEDILLRGLSPKLKMEMDGEKQSLLVEEEVNPEDVLMSLDPYAAVVNVSGGRAGGKICPHSISKMFHQVPCSFGSEVLFGSEEARTEANDTYHKYEWSIVKNLDEQGLLEKTRLALRMITKIDPANISKVAACFDTKIKPSEEIATAVKALGLPVNNATKDEAFLASVLAIFLTRNLRVSGYVKEKSSSPDKLSRQEMEICQALYRGLLVANHHAQGIEILSVPKEKKGVIANKAFGVTDNCAFGIYPELMEFNAAGEGEECQVLTWFLDAKMLRSSFRNIAKGEKVCFVKKTLPDASPKKKLEDDMIIFRCGNEICKCSFPLKENTKTKLVNCPLEDCGLQTNIWERLKLIQRLKRDCAAAKEKFENSEVELARDILKDTLEEWDRIIVRPYKDVTELEEMYKKSLICIFGDKARELVEGNEMGRIVIKKPDIYKPTEAEDEEGNKLTSKTFKISGVK